MAANKVETIFTWYFRFNGYFTTPNFTVHKDYRKKPGGGEADLLAVRFPYSKEEPKDYSFNKDSLLIIENKTDFVITEIKSGVCNINPSWLKQEYRNVEYAMRWMGVLADEKEINAAAKSIYKSSIWKPKNKNVIIRMIACGKERNKELAKKFPNLQQIDLRRAVSFLHERFNTGCNLINRSNWDQLIKSFAELCQKEHNIEVLRDWVLQKHNQKQ